MHGYYIYMITDEVSRTFFLLSSFPLVSLCSWLRLWASYISCS